MYIYTKSGRKGRIIDIMNDGEIMILLEFYDGKEPEIEWYTSADLQQCDHAEAGDTE